MINKLIYGGCIMSLCLTSCFPSFKPKVELMKMVKDESVTIKWVKSIGILDQNFPGYIIVEHINENDTICAAYNIANLDLIDKSIVIGFYGAQQYADREQGLDETKYGYKIVADTTKTDHKD